MSKYAIVTGNERGIGKALTVDLARQGYDVLVNWFESKEDGEQVVGECEEYGVKALLHYCDVRDFDQVRAMKEFALENFGKDLQIFVNNAGMSIAGKLIEQDPADYLTVMNTDLIGAMHCAHEFAPVLADNNKGRFIIIGSCSGIRSTLGNCAYGVAKAGIMGLTRGLAQELGPYGVTVNNIAPGYINTARSAAFCGPEMIAGIKRSQVLDRIGVEEYIVSAMNYLMDNPFVTGQTLMVNGGSLMF
ncbi:3-oxoacyl-[acyl-carrier-protein] reductase FabG [Desulfitobacterium hafniense]|uniref:3-oxoacyl-[acyl-carrier-protein] reductase FabG n=1 Tax=Desulfitobacterium hafniense TaxID=49338 RepID=A0A098B549_DESHA|nr:SDR family oxidoreductase [Desulfitobacterium hafniense]CDX03964.1 3-oxoacyl-[acyl-carrier-protein] reductase FabG [Desulfitobacterium hafniense]